MDEIRKLWEEMGLRLEKFQQDASGGNYDSRLGRRLTALEKLKRKYLAFSRMALIFILVWPCSLWSLRDVIGNWYLPILVIFGSYFAIGSAMDYWLYKGISSIDCYTMTVKEVADKAYYYKKMHLRFIVILLPIALICLGSFGWILRGEPYLIAGMLFGAILGLALGYRHYLDFMNEYRRLRE